MKLNKDQKRSLEQFKEHPWFKVLKVIEKEAKTELFERLSKFDVDNEKDREVIKKWQVYQNARDDFFQNTDKHLREVFENKLPWIDY